MYKFTVTLIDKRRVTVFASDQHLALRTAFDRYGVTAIYADWDSHWQEEALS